jgi:hypothetical protein
MRCQIIKIEKQIKRGQMFKFLKIGGPKLRKKYRKTKIANIVRGPKLHLKLFLFVYIDVSNSCISSFKVIRCY